MTSTFSLPLRRQAFTSIYQPFKTRSLQRHLPQSIIQDNKAVTNGRRHNSTAAASQTSEAATIPPLSDSTLSTTTTPTQPQTELSEQLLSTLPLLSLQSIHPDGAGLYATLHIHARPYLLTLGDRLRLPFRMPNVQPGDVLRLTHASTLGTRDYTLRGSPWVDARLFEARAVVAGVESEPMRVMEKTKRRNRKIKHVKSKHRYTEVLLTELRVKTMEELVKDGVYGKAGEVKASDK